LLIKRGFEVNHLSRSKGASLQPHQLHWDPKNGILDPEYLEGAAAIVHLAGAPIAEKRWTKARKKVIIDSRVKSTDLLYRSVSQLKNPPKKFISASGVGFYGAVSLEHTFTEEHKAGNDFLGHCCWLWEKSAKAFEKLGLEVSIFRTALVLSNDGGALEKLVPPIRYGLGAPLGNGKQSVPWIHLDDLCAMYIAAIEKDLKGVYNAVAPEAITNKRLTSSIASVLGKPLWLPNVPGFLLKIALGEMAIMLLEGTDIASEKIRSAGFTFQYPQLKPALEATLLKS
jgi:hypothetical protein